MKKKKDTYVLIIVILIIVLIIVLLIILIIVLKIVIVLVTAILVLEGLASEPVNGAGDDTVLELLAQTVVSLKLLINVLILLDILVLVLGGNWGSEEGEEGLGGDSLLDDTGLVSALVTLLLGLNGDGHVLALLPLDLGALGMVVDKVTAVAGLVLVVVGLGQQGVGEELVGRELELETETGLVKVGHADVDQVLKSLLILLGDNIGELGVGLQGSEPELRDT